MTPATYLFYARVTSTSGMSGAPPVNIFVPISVTVDTSFPPYSGNASTHYYYGGTGYNLPSPILAATVNGADAHGLFDNIRVSRSSSGVSEIQIETFSFETDLLLTFSTTMKGVVKSLKIPRIIFPGNFQSALFKDVLNERGGGFFSGPIVE